MEVPSWFGVEEYHLLIATIWFGFISYIIVTYMKVYGHIESSGILSRFRRYICNRRMNKEL